MTKVIGMEWIKPLVLLKITKMPDELDYKQLENEFEQREEREKQEDYKLNE